MSPGGTDGIASLSSGGMRTVGDSRVVGATDSRHWPFDLSRTMTSPG